MMRPILVLNPDRFARTLGATISSRVAQQLAPILRHIAREQDRHMTISEDILTEANSISDKATTLLGEVEETSTAIDEAIALIESLELEPADQERLNAALTTLQNAGSQLTTTAAELDADTTRLAEVTAAPDEEPPVEPPA